MSGFKVTHRVEAIKKQTLLFMLVLFILLMIGIWVHITFSHGPNSLVEDINISFLISFILFDTCLT